MRSGERGACAPESRTLAKLFASPEGRADNSDHRRRMARAKRSSVHGPRSSSAGGGKKGPPTFSASGPQRQHGGGWDILSPRQRGAGLGAVLVHAGDQGVGGRELLLAPDPGG